jgi:formate dehydrogenase subunit gamma
MRIGLKRRSAQWTVSFFTRGAVITALMLVAMNVGYLAAQALRGDPNDLVRNAVGGNLAAFTSWRDSGLLPSFAIAFVAFIVIALGHFFTFGPKDYTAKGPSDLMPWYTLWERIIHGIVLIAFVILMVTGLMVTYGRYVGGGGLPLTLRQVHELAGFVYIPSIVIMILMWLKDALPAAYDLEWFMKAGGYLGYKGALKSGRFNAGQKVWFWVIVVTAVVHIWTGLALFYQSGSVPALGGAWASNGPFTPNIYEQSGALNYLRLYTMLHLIATIPIVLMFVVHVYMSALGAKGAIGTMINGKFSRTAALQYHSEAPALKKLSAAPASDDD